MYCLVAVSLLSGCSNSATLQLAGGSQVTGVIQGGTMDSVVVESESGAVSVPRNSIEDIDHPGTVAGIGGAAMMVTGVLGVFAGLLVSATCTGECVGSTQDTAGLVTIGAGFGLAGTGLAPLIWGVETWRGSHARSQPPSEHEAPE